MRIASHGFEALTTARCRPRPFRESDLPAFARYRSDPQTARYQGWDCPFTRSDAERLYRSIHSTPFGAAGGWYQIALAGLDDERLLGDLALHFINENQVEVGFTIAPEHRRKGYAQDALSALLDRVFLDWKARRAVAICDARNRPAAGLLTRLGFRQEAHFRENVFFKGEWGDELLFACLGAEWVSRGKSDRHAE
jgi:RimJ/RimL family protein N-acetyltransferase